MLRQSTQAWRAWITSTTPLHEKTPTTLEIHFADNPPIFAWVEDVNFDFTNDRKRINRIFLEKQFPQRHFQWFETRKKGTRLPYTQNLVHGAKIDSLGFSWTGVASGMDNTVRGRNAGGYHKILWIDAIAQQALSAKTIAHLYSRIGDPANQQLWQGRFEALRKTINENYWDEEDGLYYDLAIATRRLDRVRSIASFWPLIAGIPTQQQATRMVAYLQDDTEFGGERPLPSLSRHDKQFNGATGDYWRGGIWLPTSYMVIKGLEYYGYYDLAQELATKLVALQARTYQSYTPATIWECYNPSQDAPSTEHGRRARPDFCGWSALGPISLMIENVIGIHTVSAIDRSIQWHLNIANGRQGIEHLRFGAFDVSLVFDGDKTIHATTNLPLTVTVNSVRYTLKSGTSTLTIVNTRR